MRDALDPATPARHDPTITRSTVRERLADGAHANAFMPDGDLLVWGGGQAVRHTLDALGFKVVGIEVRDAAGRLWGNCTGNARASARLYYLFAPEHAQETWEETTTC